VSSAIWKGEYLCKFAAVLMWTSGLRDNVWFFFKRNETSWNCPFKILRKIDTDNSSINSTLQMTLRKMFRMFACFIYIFKKMYVLEEK
jgi:hypothetical protein